MKSLENNSYFLKLKNVQPLYETLVLEIAGFLSFDRKTHGLDAGCGIGNHTFYLSDHFVPDGKITGVDINNNFFLYATQFAQDHGYADKVSFFPGDIFNLPFEDNSFDWCWSTDCVAYMPIKRQTAVNELARVVKPGGKVTFAAYTSQILLPGYPIIETKLNSTKTGIAPFSETQNPEDHFLRSLNMLKNANLKNCGMKTFVVSFNAPLSEGEKDGIHELIKMRWDSAKVLSKKEGKIFKDITNPQSDFFILNKEDYSGFFTYTLFYGTVPD